MNATAFYDFSQPTCLEAILFLIKLQSNSFFKASSTSQCSFSDMWFIA